MPKNEFSAEMSAGTVKKLFSGTAVLTLSAILTKLTGLVYKVPLIALVGTEGMAYFLAANHIYILLFVISTAGLPVAVAVMVAGAVARGEYDAVRRVYRTAAALFGTVGIAATTFMAAGAGLISRLVGIPQAIWCIIAIAPAVALACVAGALRGYFQGHQIMVHTAVSQMIEAFGKLVFGLAGAYLVRKAGADTPFVAAGAIAGITLGVGMSALYLAVVKVAFDKRYYAGASDVCGDRICKTQRSASGIQPEKRRTQGSVIGQLLRLALPVTLSSAVISLGGVIDTALIPKSLMECGFSQSRAYTLFSCYGNMAIPLFSLTPALVSPIAMTLVPLVSSARGRGDETAESEAVSTAIRLTLALALPASLGLAMLSEPVLCLIFASDTSAALTAAPLLSILALSIVPACLITATNAILQAQGRAESTIVSMLCGTAVKLASELILVRRPDVNIFGAPLSTLLCDIVVVAVNIYMIVRCSPASRGFWRPVITMGICAVGAVGGAGIVWFLTPLGHMADSAVIPAVVLAAAVYAVLMLVCRVIRPEELLRKGSKNDGETTENRLSSEP